MAAHSQATRPAAPACAATAAAAAADTPAAALPALAADIAQRRYGLGHGFTYRREAFGGILYHYEGIRPDPRVTFVDNAFLIDLLDALAANPDATLSELLGGVQAHFGLGAAQRARMDAFFATLIERGALVAV